MDKKCIEQERGLKPEGPYFDDEICLYPGRGRWWPDGFDGGWK